MNTVPTKENRTFSIRLFPSARRGVKPRAWLAAVFRILEALLIIIPLWQYVLGGPDRRRSKHYQAWQVIALAGERGGDGGRRQALQDLHEDGIPLRGVEISGAVMDSLDLPGASLKWARFENTNLTNASLRAATFGRARLDTARFINSDLQGADLSMASAAGAAFNGTALCGALFIGTDLKGAQFPGAAVDEANFSGADLRGANFGRDALPLRAVFKDANIAQINASETFVAAALASGAVVMREAEWRRKREADDARLKALWRAVPNPADSITPRRVRDCRSRTRPA